MNSENSVRTAYPISSGSSEPFQVSWETFVQFVLKITVEAYQRMRQDGVAQKDWEENYHQIHFVWECKRISDGSLDKANDFLVAEYVTSSVSHL